MTKYHVGYKECSDIQEPDHDNNYPKVFLFSLAFIGFLQLLTYLQYVR